MSVHYLYQTKEYLIGLIGSSGIIVSSSSIYGSILNSTEQVLGNISVY
jgi:hypothetical protein